MSYSEAEKNDILYKAIQIAIGIAARTKTGFAPDILIEPAIKKANEFIEKYQDRPNFDIWKNGRLDLYINNISHNIMIQNYFDYELSEDNFEAVDALIEAENILGGKASDKDLFVLFDYTPEELTRLRIIAKYLNGIDRQATCDEFARKYHIGVI